MNKQYKNILVVALRKIGDTIIATSIPYMLKKAYPNAKITILVKPLVRDIVVNNPVLDEVLLYNYTHHSSWQEMQQTAKLLKAKQFDLAIVADNKPRSAMLTWLAGIPARVGFEKIEFRNIYLKLFYTKIINIDYDAMQVQQVKNHEIFINRFTGRNDRAKMIMPEVNQQAKEKIDKIVQAGIPERLKIAICIRSGCVTKDWQLTNFSAVIEYLTQYFAAEFYIIGSPADKNAAIWLQDNTKADIINLAGVTSLPELGYLLTQMKFFLTVDTGAAHIGAAMHVPMVTIFGSTSPDKWGPYSDTVLNIKPQYPCHPCDGKKINCNMPRCLETISAAAVGAACVSQINKYL